MDLQTKLSIVNALSTFLAVVVALVLGVSPSVLRKVRERRLAIKRSHKLLSTIKMVVKNYRFYNPQKVIQDGVTQYQYDVSNIKGMSINIDLYQEVQNLNLLAENLPLNHKLVVTETIDLLVAITSGFPFSESEWNHLEELISKSLESLEK
ncbi:hypothetical protein OA92_09655 [Marinomonas sp. SBI22]|uniref:hypothetical protein n=1 Tax=unclassified Marinomonas TaxID=196814 RepID=UPI0007AFBBB3|nr:MULTISPECIES: hypothetical protein [unclassified Marinomonas]KZM43032.1 hypothetical protein OA92_09655 [Marinomonas sp. SBI22]KZM44602.1 hypothetical protein OA91_09080 [Marinomonas sp. SBI8L]